MTAPDEIKGGQYELLSEIWDEPTSEVGKPYTFKRHVKGDIVTLDAEEARRLVTSGAVVKKGEREKQAAIAAKAQYEATLALLPDEVREQLTANEPSAREAELEAQLAALQAQQGQQTPPAGGKAPAKS